MFKLFKSYVFVVRAGNPTLHAQLHRATMFLARNGPHFGVCFVFRSDLAQIEKAEKVGNSVQVDMEG